MWVYIISDGGHDPEEVEGHEVMLTKDIHYGTVRMQECIQYGNLNT